METKKLKLALASDLHLEFGDIVLENKENADILILAGDICLAKDCAKDNYIGERVQKLGLVINLSFFYFTISKIITKIESSLLSY
jgi:predicted phosphodiesterase